MKRRPVFVVVVAVATIGLLAGCVAAASAKPSASAVAAPSDTLVPTPAAPAAPTVRVHTSCDELVPPAMIEQLTGRSLPAVAPQRTTSPATYADARVGSLECQWSNGVAAGVAGSAAVYLTLAPDATRAGFEYFLNGEQGGGISTSSTVGPDTYLLGSSGPQASGGQLGFIFLTDHYGASAYVIIGGSASTVQRTATQSLLQHVYGIVSALPAPDPLWRPTPDLRGATDCDHLATAQQLAATVGLPTARAVKTDDGEYSSSLFNVDRQVGGFWCIWGSDSPSSADARVAVLPGGAIYAAQVRTAGSRDIPGLGDSAFIAADGELNVVAAGGWVQVGASAATDAQLVALARVVLANNGYTQG